MENLGDREGETGVRSPNREEPEEAPTNMAEMIEKLRTERDQLVQQREELSREKDDLAELNANLRAEVKMFPKQRADLVAKINRNWDLKVKTMKSKVKTTEAEHETSLDRIEDLKVELTTAHAAIAKLQEDMRILTEKADGQVLDASGDAVSVRVDDEEDGLAEVSVVSSPTVFSPRAGGFRDHSDTSFSDHLLNDPIKPSKRKKRPILGNPKVAIDGQKDVVSPLRKPTVTGKSGRSQQTAVVVYTSFARRDSFYEVLDLGGESGHSETFALTKATDGQILDAGDDRVNAVFDDLCKTSATRRPIRPAPTTKPTTTPRADPIDTYAGTHCVVQIDDGFTHEAGRPQSVIANACAACGSRLREGWVQMCQSEQPRWWIDMAAVVSEAALEICSMFFSPPAWVAAFVFLNMFVKVVLIGSHEMPSIHLPGDICTLISIIFLVVAIICEMMIR